MSLWHCKGNFKLWRSLLISPPYTGIWVCFLVLYYSTKRSLTTSCWCFCVWKAVWESQAKTMKRETKKQNLSTCIYVICVMKNSQQLLRLCFCLTCRIDLKSCWQFEDHQETGEKHLCFLYGRETQRKNSPVPILPLDICCQDTREKVSIVSFIWGKTDKVYDC